MRGTLKKRGPLRASLLLRSLENKIESRLRIPIRECIVASIDDNPKQYYAKNFQAFLIALNDNTDFSYEIVAANSGCIRFYYHATNFSDVAVEKVIGQIRMLIDSPGLIEALSFDRVTAFNKLVYNSGGRKVEHRVAS